MEACVIDQSKFIIWHCLPKRQEKVVIGCSTQPVLYHFKTIEDVRIAAHKKASEFHINYVTNISGKYERPMLEVGMRHIQFAMVVIGQIISLFGNAILRFASLSASRDGLIVSFRRGNSLLIYPNGDFLSLGELLPTEKTNGILWWRLILQLRQ